MTKMQGNASRVQVPGPSLAEAIESSALRLTQAGIPRGRFEAGLLLGHATGLPHERIVADRERKLKQSEALHLDDLVARRVTREPMAHILGTREFWSLDFRVTREVLIPRPESETLIEAALELVPDRAAPLRVLDLGTGTGCLLLALLSELPHGAGLGIDRSEAACGVAWDNGVRLGLDGRARFLALDWNDAGFERRIRSLSLDRAADLEPRDGRFDLVLANPPYIPDRDIDALEPEVRHFEPRAALAGGPDGLAAYRVLAPSLARLLTPEGAVLFEIGQGQGTDVAQLMTGAGLIPRGLRRDLAGIERCLVFAIP